MIRVANGVAAIKVDNEIYSVEALNAAAAAFSARAKINIDKGVVSIKPKDDAGAAGETALEFLNEALSHQYRLFVQAMNMPALAPILARAKENGFAPPPLDWVKEREPQVAKDREREIKQLMEEARKRGAK